jgi:hypothetical protein
VDLDGGVGAADGDTVHTGQNKLLDRVGLLLRVLIIRCPPVDLDLQVVPQPKIAGGIFRADPRDLEYRIALGLPKLTPMLWGGGQRVERLARHRMPPMNKEKMVRINR